MGKIEKMVLNIDDSYRQYTKVNKTRLTGNNQYEDMDKRFTMNDVPSGEELFDAIKCNIHGLVRGYYRKYKGEQVIDWTKCCTTNLFDREGEELTYDSFKKMVDGKMNRYDLSHISQE